MNTTPRALLTVEQAAERLGIGRTTTYALIKSGGLESITVGRLRRVPETAVTDYINKLAADQQGV
jgi:excisionase family DNA binding protein